MQLYTINATPVREDKSDYDNTVRINEYHSKVAEILARRKIEGFTIYQVTGYWNGTQEVSFKIEVAHDKVEDISIICLELRDAYSQDSVMLTKPDNSVEFI